MKNYPNYVYVAEYEYYMPDGMYDDSYYVYIEGAKNADEAKTLEEYFRPDGFESPDKMHRIKVRNPEHLKAIVMVCDQSGSR